MRFTYIFLLQIFIVVPVISADGLSLKERLEQLAPHAAGLAQVEVLDMKEIDDRAGCGPLYIDVRLRLLQRSGATRDSIHIILDPGGNPGNPNFKPFGPVMPNTFTKGQRYWVAFSPSYIEFDLWPQKVVRCWPDKSGPEVLSEAIRADYYSHRPQYDPRSGFTHSFISDQEARFWRVRLSRDGNSRWEVKLPGKKFRGIYDGELRLYHRDDWPHGLGHADDNRSNWFLLAETQKRLETANRFQLPPEDYRMIYALDADSGKIASIRISLMRLSPMATPSVVQYFDLNVGGLEREERFDLLPHGGVAVGAEKERWYRKVVRTIDPKSGKISNERVFRHTSGPGGSKFVPLTKH